MTGVNLTQRFNWKVTALGLAVSLGLIFSASGIMRFTEPCVESGSAPAGNVAESVEQVPHTESPAMSPTVPVEGHWEHRHTP